MRFFRLMATGMLLLVLAGAILGTACAGARGEQGSQGIQGADGVGIRRVVDNGDGTISLTDGSTYTTDMVTGPQGPQGPKGDTGAAGATGATGAQGEAGPNMVKAMGTIASNGDISLGYNVTSVTWDTTYHLYRIALTGITYASYNYVTVITLVNGDAGHTTETNFASGQLTVYIYDSAGNPVQGYFHFVVLRP
jgi:hypothetical protein